MDMEELGALQRRFEQLKPIAEKQEARVDYYETKVQNIALAYLIWGRFFFFAISSSGFTCNHWWLAFTLNSLCTFIYLVLFLNAAVMLYRTQHQLGVIYSKQTTIYRRISAAKHRTIVDSSMEAGGSGEGFGVGFMETMILEKTDAFGIVVRKVHTCAIVCALLAAAAIELYACKFLLCG